MFSRKPLCSERKTSLLLANPPGAAGSPGPQEPALFSMGGMFALLGLEAKAHFPQDNQKTSQRWTDQGLRRLREASSFQLGSMATLLLLWAAHHRALHSGLYPARRVLGRQGCGCSARSAPEPPGSRLPLLAPGSAPGVFLSPALPRTPLPQVPPGSGEPRSWEPRAGVPGGGVCWDGAGHRRRGVEDTREGRNKSAAAGRGKRVASVMQIVGKTGWVPGTPRPKPAGPCGGC